MKTLVVEWQRLLDEQKQTCPRCGSTEQEVDKAAEEVGKLREGGQAYRLAGSVFVPKEKDALEKDLKEDKEKLQVRKSVLEKQEARLAERLDAVRRKAEKLQKGDGAGIAKGN